MTLWIRKRSLTRFVWAVQSLHDAEIIMIRSVRGDIGLSVKNASLLCGIYTDCSLRQKVWRVLSSLTGRNLPFGANIVLLWLSDS